MSSQASAASRTFSHPDPSFPSEFASALEFLKLLHSVVDSVEAVSAPFSSSSVLKSALGEPRVAGGKDSGCSGPPLAHGRREQKPFSGTTCQETSAPRPDFPRLGTGHRQLPFLTGLKRPSMWVTPNLQLLPGGTTSCQLKWHQSSPLCP